MEPQDTIFLSARQMADPVERAAYLTQACGNDAALRQRVEAMLRDAAGADEFFGQEPAVGTVTEGPGTVIGRYKLLQKIGEGGMGVVYMAEQREPVIRKVALKIIKLGMDTRQVVARFEAERQALALMDHPNIAKVLDGGATESGRLYFVMDLVPGLPITQFCDEANLATRERLELFLEVCSAVQHAHQKGIIHRDLKPSNILVTLHGEKPVPKVIDFGVAKLTAGRLTEKTLFTQFQQFIGTPAYMSPEQASLSGLDIDTRSDIYALGVLLYELLTGRTPFDGKELLKAGLDEMRRTIQETEPPRPSNRLSTLKGEDLTATALRRRTDPPKLVHLVRGDLDWIVMKCLEKDRARRYETANGLAADLSRHLNNEAVAARPPSAGYRFQKAFRRNQLAFTAAVVVALALVLGMAGTAWQARRAAGQRDLAIASKLEADAQRKEAEAEKKISEAVKDFLLNKLLYQADARLQANTLLNAGRLATDVKDNPTIRDLVDRAAEELTEARIEANFPKEPRLQAEVLSTVGNTYRGIGEYERAIEFLQRSLALSEQQLGPEHPDTLESMNNLALACESAGKLDLAVPLFEETLKRRKAKLGPEHPDTLRSMNDLAGAYELAGKLDLAVPLSEETLKLRKAKLSPEHADTLQSMNNLALAYQAAGKLDLAMPLFEETLNLLKAKLGPEHPDTLQSMNNLGEAYQAAGKLNLAVPILEETLNLRKAKLGPEHPDTLESMNNLAGAYQAAGKLNLAAPLFEETLKLRKAKLGPEHPDTLESMNNLALAYQAAGKLDLAMPLFEETLRLVKAKLGPEHPNTLQSMNNLAGTYQAVGKLDLAVPLFEETLKLRKATLGPGHPDTLDSMNNLAGAYQEAGKPNLAAPLFEEALKLQKAKLGPAHPATLRTAANLGVNYKNAGRLDEAVPLLEQTYQASKQGPLVAWVGGQLLDAYTKGAEANRQGDRAKALALVQELLAAGGSLPKDSPELAGNLAACGAALLALKAWDQAEPIFVECLAIRQRSIPDDWRTFNTKAMLGGSLLGQKKYAQAEPLLLSGYDGLKQREDRIPAGFRSPRLKEALQRLVQLYEDTGRPDQAAAWQQKLAEFDKAGTTKKADAPQP